MHNIDPDNLTAFRTRLDAVFKGSLVFQDKKPKSPKKEKKEPEVH